MLDDGNGDIMGYSSGKPNIPIIPINLRDFRETPGSSSNQLRTPPAVLQSGTSLHLRGLGGWSSGVCICNVY